MKVEIFDVEHGQCAMITCPPNGKKLMIDAGHNTGKWWPSSHFKGQNIEELVITNFDEDHTSDVENVRKNCNVKAIARNPSINSSILRQMKESTGGMGNGIKHLHDWMIQVENAAGGIPITVDLGDVLVNQYWIKYPTFNDANNLSLVSFVSYGSFTILFPGDLEICGWKEMLKNDDFKNDVRRTTVLVASHHGRENGCCEELYNVNPLIGWKPCATIISDAGKEHATQETVSWYANRTVGCRSLPNGTERKVFTTRSDGKITIDVEANGTWYIGTARSQTISRASLLGL